MKNMYVVVALGCLMLVNPCAATLSTLLEDDKIRKSPEQAAVETFVKTTGCQPERWASAGGVDQCTSPLLDAFGYEGRPENLEAIVGTDHYKTLERWVDSLGDPSHLEGKGFMSLSLNPEQVHIAMTPTKGNVSVLWTTNTSATTSQVCWWAKSTDSQTCANGSTWTFDPTSVIPWSGNIHGGFMTGLNPGDRYCYSVGEMEGARSGHHCFTCPQPETTGSQTEWLFALGGDMGSYQIVGHLMAAQMRADEVAHNLKFDAFWHLGDIAYSTLDPPNWNFEFFWDVYMRQEQSFADHVPMMVTYGNHDFGGGDSASYRHRFANPSTPTTPTGSQFGANPFYWSYEHGPIKYVSMCTEVGLNPTLCNYAPGSVQYQWLERELATVNRTKTPWLILAGHRPMYSSDKGTDSGSLREMIEPLMVQYKVDLELAGHMHETEVISPVNKFVANMTGVTVESNNSFVFQNAGAPAHLTMGTLGALISEKWDNPKPTWSLFHKGTIFDDAYGYVQLRATASQLHFEFKRQMDNSTMWSLKMKK